MTMNMNVELNDEVFERLAQVLIKAFKKAFTQMQKDDVDLKKIHWFLSEREKDNLKELSKCHF